MQATNNKWKTRVKTAVQAAFFMQATEDDLAQLERFQQDALGSIGLKVGFPLVQEDWARPQCQKCFRNKQAMIMHEVTKHKAMHVSHAYMPATNCPCCMWEYHINEKTIRHLNTIQKCIPKLRLFAPEGLRYGKTITKVAELQRQQAKLRRRLSGPLRWPQDLPPGAILPQPRRDT